MDDMNQAEHVLGIEQAQGLGHASGTESLIETEHGIDKEKAFRDEQAIEPGKAFEPAIVGFLCNWCSYAGADLAGTSRLSYPTNLRVIRVMCSGRVDPGLMLEPFLRGADGVMVLGCHPADCHYLTGNYQAEQRVFCVRAVLEHLGIESGRLYLDWVSASEGARFAELVMEFAHQVKRLGPIGGRESREGLPLPEFMRRVQVAKRVTEGEKFRWLVGRRKALLEEENVYKEQLPGRRFHDLMSFVVVEECLRAAIELLTEEGPMSVKDMAETLGVSARKVLEHTAYLKKFGFLELHDVIGCSPRYVSLKHRLSKGERQEGFCLMSL